MKSVQWDGEYFDDYKIHPRARLVDEKGHPQQLSTDEFAIQLAQDPDANPATLALIDQLKLEPIRRQYNLLRYVNVFVRLRPQDLGLLAAQPDVISIQPYMEPRKLDERQDQIVAGNLSGNAPTGPAGYLAWLASNGFTQEQFTASGFAVDISDSGIDNGTTAPGHFALYTLGDNNKPSRVIYTRLEGTPNASSTLQGCDGHGAINTHIVCGYDAQPASFPHTDSGGFYYGLGVCPFVNVGSSVIFDPDNFTYPNYADLLSQAYQDGARISNNSWGDAGSAGVYDSDAQAYDALVRDAQPAGSAYPAAGNQEMVIVFSAGDDGPSAQTVTAPASAKNVFAVGAAENVRSMSTANGGNNSAGNDGCDTPDTDANNSNDIASFSSRGPCADGRIKPDLVAPGSHITGGAPQSSPPPSPGGTGAALSCFLANGDGVCGMQGGGTGSGGLNDFFPGGQQFFTESSGTSHSAPAVSGACALLRQYFINQSLRPPGPAMTKAYLMNSARYMTGSGANDSLWSNSQGMGELDLGMAFDGTPRVLRDEFAADKFTETGQTRTFSGTISDSSKPFRVTLAWTDAPGSTTASKALNNDLDLTVTVGGATYRGNVFNGAYSVTGGSADRLNNVESVFLPAGTTGNYAVTITAAAINSDGVPGDADPLDQDFALVIYNSESMPVANVVADAATIVAESCTPTNGAIDPGETVTVNFSLKNVGTADTGNLVATLLATGGVSTPDGPQTFGVLTAGGGSVVLPFTFTASGACGGAITNTFQLQDGAANLGVATFILPLGRQTIDFAENFDEVTPPALPSGWTTSATSGQSGWMTSAGSADTSPNAAFSPEPSTAGVNQLVTPPIPIATASAQLTFSHSYNLEASPTVAYDGGVLEIKIGNGSFADILAAGGSFTASGYDYTISTKWGNPLAGRHAWSGDSGGFVTTIVNLPRTVAGKDIQLRWRCGTDNGTSGAGWYVDGISISESACCGGTTTNGGFASLAGSYQGLVQSNSPSLQTSGFVNITVTAVGSFSAKLTFDGAMYSFKGTFDGNGDATADIAHSGANPLTVTLHLDLTNGTERITGTVSDGTFTSDLIANLSAGSSSVPAFQGYYTVLLLPNPADAGSDFPQGNGYGTLKVNAQGKAQFSGKLADGTKITQTATVSEDGTWPVHVPLYAKVGLLSGWVTVTNIVGVSDLSGTLNWIKPASPTAKYFPDGFSTAITLEGSKYTAPSTGTPVLERHEHGLQYSRYIRRWKSGFVREQFGDADRSQKSLPLRHQRLQADDHAQYRTILGQLHQSRHA